MFGNLRSLARRPSPGTALGFTALLVALGGGAYAAIPGGNGDVTACLGAGGQLKVIDAEAGETCQGNQTELTLASTQGGKVADADKLDGRDATAFGAGLVSGRINDLNTAPGSSAFGAPSGTSAADASEEAREMLTPDAPIVAQELRVELTDPPGAGNSRIFRLRVNGADSALNCAMIGLADECSSVGPGTVLIPAGSRISIRSVAGTGTPQPADALFGWRTTMP